MRYKLLKPDWAKLNTRDGKPNPDFIKEIPGDDTLEGDFSDDYLKAKNEEGYNIYFFPNFPANLHPEIRYARGEHIDVFDYVFVDMDLKDEIYPSKEAFIQKLREFPVQPTVVSDSGHGIHAYWKITNLTRDAFVYTQLRLINHFKTDESIWTVKQIMRAPGYLNTKKYGEFVPAVVIDGFSGAEISLETLGQHLPPLSEDDRKSGLRHLNKIDGIDFEDDLEDVNADDLPERFTEDLTKDSTLKQLWEDPKAYKGDRSSADMKLANILFSKDYDKVEAFKVLYNTQKARSRDPHHRYTYSYAIVDRVYKDRPKHYEDSVAEHLQKVGTNQDLGKLVYGPKWIDCQEEGWRRSQVLGLVIGTGIGKTTFSLDMIRHILKNNPKGRFIYFSLEMPKQAIIKKWLKLTNNDPELAKRFHIVSNETGSNDIRHIGLQEVVWITKEIRKVTGEEIIGICIDHMGELSNVVDLTKYPDFNAKGEIGPGNNGKYRAIGYQNLCSKIKDIAKMLNVFVIMQSQTSRQYDKSGDTPIPKSGAFGASNFEKMVHWMVTAWQPLLKVYGQTNLRITAWQYAKLRTQSENDPIKIEQPRMLKFDMRTGAYGPLSGADEVEEFNRLKAEADKLRAAEEKNKGSGVQYLNSPGAILELLSNHEKLKNVKV